MRLPLLAVLGALAVGIAIPLLWNDDDSTKRPLSARDVEQRLLRNPFGFPLGSPGEDRPTSASCKLAGNAKYHCVVSYKSTGKGIANSFGYDIEVDAYEPPPDQREAALRNELSADYRNACRREPPQITV